MAELINGRFRDALLFVDGYSQAELAESHHQALCPFHFLATSSYYDVKPSEIAEMVVLPAWRRSDLLAYARLTNWADNAGFSAVTLTEPKLKDLVNQQYYYSGGSLSQFCKTRPQFIRRVDLDFQVVGKVGEAIGRSPFYCYKDSRKNENLDRVCRHYVADASDPLHYTRWSQWKFCIDSGYALANLGEEMTSKELYQVYQYGKSIDAGFQAAAFKLFFHRAIYEGTYWHPENATFPFADAVALLTAYAAANARQRRREVYLIAVISVIAEDDEACQRNQLDKVSQTLKSNAKLKDYKHVLLVVRPKIPVAESGIPRRAPEWTPFAAMEGSFE
ncbi:hypothetical protein AeNC1_015043 [Aphanomyces euteiches]|nr:hypothetical protein AeNC1_015043 [Aphanomyces euteiches]